MAAASPAASSEVVSQPETAEGVVLPIAQGSLEEMKTGSDQFAADITNVDAKKHQMTMTVYAYDSYRAEDIDGLEAGEAIRIHPDGAVEAQDLTVESIERNEETGIVSINGGIEQGGVGEHFEHLLHEAGFHGAYVLRAIQGFVRHATMQESFVVSVARPESPRTVALQVSVLHVKLIR